MTSCWFRFILVTSLIFDGFERTALSYSPTEMRKNNSLFLKLCLTAQNCRHRSVHYASVSGLAELCGGSHLYPHKTADFFTMEKSLESCTNIKHNA